MYTYYIIHNIILRTQFSLRGVLSDNLINNRQYENQ